MWRQGITHQLAEVIPDFSDIIAGDADSPQELAAEPAPMPFYDLLKKVYEGIFLWIQGRMTQRLAAEHLTENLQVLEQTAKAAAELIGATDELAASDDPHKKRLAALVKDYATEGFEQVTKGRLSAKEFAAIEPDHPFSETSPRSSVSLPDSTPKPLPPPSPPQKRGRGRPRKNPQENPQA